MRRRNSTRIKQLRALSAFASCNDAELEKIDTCGTLVTVGEDRVVARQGTVPRECFVIRSGQVEVFDGDRHVATRGPGSWVGEMALVDGTVRCAQARTSTPTELLVFDAGEMGWLLRQIPSLAASLRVDGIQRRVESEAVASQPRISLRKRSMALQLAQG